MIRRVGIFLACLLPALVASAAGLQALIDATPAGGTLRLAPGSVRASTASGDVLPLPFGHKRPILAPRGTPAVTPLKTSKSP